MSQPDPRVFFAAERTLLAWLRSGITLVGLGFVIARFGIFLRFISYQVPTVVQVNSGFSGLLGIIFVLAGVFVAAIATIQHKRYVSTIPLNDLPPSYSTKFALAFGLFLSIIGLILAVYLAITQA